MSKVLVSVILGGLVLAAIAVINIHGVNAQDDPRFLPISVLSKEQANYGSDENLGTIPAISVEILEDKAQDTQLESSSVQIIRYTSLPVDNGAASQENNNEGQSVDKSKDKNSHGNANANQPGGGAQTPEANGKTKPDKNNNGNGANTDKGKGNTPDKVSAPENKGSSAPEAAPEAAPDKGNNK